MSEANAPESVVESFKLAMRELATTVSVITTGDDSIRGGLTATAVTSLSMEPAAILICVNRTASAWPLIEKSGQFCVNLLARSQEDVANVFAGRSGCESHERFQEAGEWTFAHNGVSMLDGAMANVVCKLDKVIDHGTHAICIGAVTEVRLADSPAPLIYCKQGYDTVSSAAAALAELA